MIRIPCHFLPQKKRAEIITRVVRGGSMADQDSSVIAEEPLSLLTYLYKKKKG
jgi:hypothetical protein